MKLILLIIGIFAFLQTYGQQPDTMRPKVIRSEVHSAMTDESDGVLMEWSPTIEYLGPGFIVDDTLEVARADYEGTYEIVPLPTDEYHIAVILIDGNIMTGVSFISDLYFMLNFSLSPWRRPGETVFDTALGWVRIAMLDDVNGIITLPGILWRVKKIQ